MIQVTRDAERFVTRRPGIVSRHLLSFGDHYDPARIAIGPVVAYNEETVEPGYGFDEHPHRGIDIVTWVVTGVLRHHDDARGDGLVRPGQVQVLRSAGGVRHAEVNQSDEPLRFVQVWLTPGDQDESPSYATCSLDETTLAAGFVAVVSGSSDGGPGALRIGIPGASLYATHLRAAVERELPTGSRQHCLVTSGSVSLAGREGRHQLSTGDSALVVGEAAAVTGLGSRSELLVWTLPLR